MKKLFSSILAAALVWTAPGLGAFQAFAAQTPKKKAALVPELGAREAVQLFVDRGLIKGFEDPRLAYLVGQDESGVPALSGLGSLLARYLVLLEGVRKVEPSAVEGLEARLADLRSALASSDTPAVDKPVLEAKIRKIGVLLDGQRAVDSDAAAQTQKNIEELMAQLAEGGGAPEEVEKRLEKMGALSSALQGFKLDHEDIYSVGVALNAVMTGVEEDLAGPAAKPDYVVTKEDGFLVARDRRTGRLYRREDEQHRIYFAREILERQQKYNEFIRSGALKGASLIPETGRLNQGTLSFPYYEMSGQLDQLRAHLRLSELYALLELTNQMQSYRPDQLSDPAEQAALIAKLGEHRLSNGRLAKDVVAELFKKYEAFVSQAQEALASYKRRLDLIHADDLINNGTLAELKVFEQQARKFLSLAWLEGQIQLAGQQKKRLSDPAFDKILSATGADAKVLAALGGQKALLGERAEQIMRLYASDQKALLAGDIDSCARLQDEEEAKACRGREGAKIDAAQRLYAGSQGQGQTLQLAMQAFTTVPSLLKAARETDSVNDEGFLKTGLSFKYAGDWWAERAHERFGWFSGHVNRVRNIAASQGALKAAMDSVAGGNYQLARAHLAALAPQDELQEHLNIQPGQDVTELARMTASVDAFNQELQDVQDAHFWVQFGGEMVLTSALAAVAAPAATGLLAGAARGAKVGADAMEAVGGAARVAGWGLRGAERISESFAWGLESLNNASNVPGFIQGKYFVRGWNMLSREAVASATMAGLSGGMAAEGHYRNGIKFWEANEHSPYRSGWEAFKTGAKFGSEFPVKPENLPWLVGGLPGHLFGLNNPVGKFWFNMSKGGLVGGSVAMVTGRDVVGEALGGMGLKGGLGFVGSFGLGMADQMAKYYAFNEAIGVGAEKAHQWGGEAYRWYKGHDDRDLSEESLRARDDVAELPEGPDKDALIGQIRSEELSRRELDRMKEDQKAGALGREVGWRLVPVFPANMMVNAEEFYAADQGFKQYQDAGRLHEIANSAVGAELKMVTPAQLPLYQQAFMRGARKRSPEVQTFRVSEDMKMNAIREELAQATRSDPAELYRVSQLPEDTMIGERLRVTKEVHSQAKEAFEDALKKDPLLASQLMAAEPPAMARKVLEAQDPQLAKGLERGAAKGEARAALERTAQGLREEAALAMFENAGSEGVVAQVKARLSGQASNLERAREILEPYIRSEQSVNEAAERMLKVLKGNAGPSEALRAEGERMLAEVREWRDATDPADNTASYMKLVEKWRGRLKDLQGLSAADSASLSAMLDYIEALQGRFSSKKLVNGKETLLIQNKFGKEIPGLRPEQFEVLANFLSNLVVGGKNATEYMRAFLKLSTGGGKTLLVFEGLLPVVMADAELAPSGVLKDGALYRRKPKVVFITTNTLLESQARSDFKAFRKVLSDVEIMTAEEFKGRIAEGKMWGNKGRPEDYWVIADEFDGLALQPALTIGEQTALVSKDHPAYRRLETLAEELSAVAQTPGLSASQLRSAVAGLKAEQGRVLREARVTDKAAAARLRDIFDQMGQAALKGDGGERVAALREAYAVALQRGVGAENPVYEVFRRMKTDAAREVESPSAQSGPEAYAAFEKLKALGRSAADKLAQGPSEAAAKEIEVLAARQEELLGQAKVQDPVQVEKLRSTMQEFKAAAKAQADASPARLKVLAKGYQEALEGGVRSFDYQAVMDRELTRRTKERGKELLGAFWKDPNLDGVTKATFMYKAAWSWMTGGGWVRQEIANMAAGMKEGGANVRMDNPSGKVHPIHNGEFVPTMDTPTRRFHELEYGADLTLPYEHREISTVRDLTERPKVRFLGTSGTNPDLLAAHLKKNGVEVLGEGTKANKVEPVFFDKPSDKFNGIARQYREGVETGKRDILVVGFSNSRELKQTYEMLRRMGVEKEKIARIFSDTEYIRNNYPKAKVAEQMNLDAIKTGRVKVLLMDMRVGGRGLDLPFKDGKYMNAEILILDPQEIAGVHDIQFQGRTAPNRMPGGALREYYYYTDMQTASKNPTLKRLGKGKVTPELVKQYLSKAQEAAELDQLRSSSVLHDAPPEAGEGRK